MSARQPINKIASGLPVEDLKRQLNAQPELFGEHSERKYAPGSPHGGMTDIWVRYNAYKNFNRANPAAFNEPHDSVWYPAYRKLPGVCAPVFGVMAMVAGERLGGVLITKIPPGGGVAKHTDSGWHASYYDKFYVPVQNEPGATFNFEGITIDPQEGDVYWFDNSFPHWVENKSLSDRIAMIVCVRTEMFRGPQ